MAQALPTVESIDADIVRLRQEVTALQAHRSALRTSILSDCDATDRLRNSATTSQSRQLDALISHQSSQNELQAHRLCAGATLFNPHQSGPFVTSLKKISVLRHDWLLGVRIERFDRRKGEFTEPAYLLFRSSSISSEQGRRTAENNRDLEKMLAEPLTVFHHTLPTNISVSAMERRYLSQENGADESPSARLLSFVQECQRALSMSVDDQVTS